ncbi:MAG: glycosyltransferase family 2 protein [Candidatus Omnitrophica bacterium]|nr:glycosyltransferase family 2 protein [Candidatus Omnitrophota bacterium]
MIQEKKKLSIVSPLANESETLESFYKEIIKHISPFEDRIQIKIFFVVDNASKDNTRKIVESLQKQDSRVQLVWAPQNRCVVDAYLAGFKAAIEDTTDYILEMDGGGTHLPGEIPHFINKLFEGYDCVFGSRFTKDAEMDASLRRHFFSRGGTIVARILLGMKMSDATSGFEAFKKDILKAIISKKLVSIGHFYQTEIRFRAKDFNYAEVPIHYSNPVNKIPSKYIRNAFYGLLVCFFERVRGVKYG